VDRFDLPPIDDIVAATLAEDLGVPASRLLAAARGEGEPGLVARDATGAVLLDASTFSGLVRARETGVACGLPVAARAFEMFAEAVGRPDDVDVFPLVAEGSDVSAGDAVLEVSGSARLVLAAERSALDLLMTLCGIATQARAWQAAAGPSLAVYDTRKTWPGLRALSKYAARVGGAHNHRLGLWDALLVKDNHVRCAGGVAAAVSAARAAHPDLVLEVEADTVEQALEAARAGADVVLLDNMDDATLAAAVSAVREAAAGRAVLTEASGGVTLERLPGIAAAGVDRVSSSALTLAAPLDLGLDEKRAGCREGGVSS